MKSLFKVMFAVVLMLTTAISYAGHPVVNYTITINNVVSQADDSATFDVSIKRVDGDSLKLQKYSMRIDFDYAGVADGGDLTVGYISGTADDAVLAGAQLSPTISMDNANSQIVISCSGVSYSSTKNIGTSNILLGTFYVKNSKNFVAGATPDLKVKTLHLMCWKDANKKLPVDLADPANNFTSDNHSFRGHAIINKTYTALLTQTGTSAPSAKIKGDYEPDGHAVISRLGTVSWSRSSAGVYVGTLTGKMGADTSFFYTLPPISATKRVYLSGHTVNSFTIVVDSSGTAVDANLTNYPIEIRVYQ